MLHSVSLGESGIIFVIGKILHCWWKSVLFTFWPRKGLFTSLHCTHSPPADSQSKVQNKPHSDNCPWTNSCQKDNFLQVKSANSRLLRCLWEAKAKPLGQKSSHCWCWRGAAQTFRRSADNPAIFKLGRISFYHLLDLPPTPETRTHKKGGNSARAQNYKRAGSRKWHKKCGRTGG